MKKYYRYVFLPDCHNVKTVCQRRTAPTLFQPYVPTGHVPAITKAPSD